MIHLPDLAILDVLVSGENELLTDLDTFVAEIFAGRPEAEQEAIKEFYRAGINPERPDDTVRYRVRKVLGFPSGPEELPCWAVTTASEQESTQAVGDVLMDATPDMRDDPEANYIARGAMFSGTYAISCYATNPALCAYLQAVAKWILLRYRDALGDLGIIRQRINCLDLQPYPEAQPAFAFVRQVQLNCTYTNFWLERVGSVAGLIITPTCVGDLGG